MPYAFVLCNVRVFFFVVVVCKVFTTIQVETNGEEYSDANPVTQFERSARCGALSEGGNVAAAAKRAGARHARAHRLKSCAPAALGRTLRAASLASIHRTAHSAKSRWRANSPRASRCAVRARLVGVVIRIRRPCDSSMRQAPRRLRAPPLVPHPYLPFARRLSRSFSLSFVGSRRYAWRYFRFLCTVG